MTNYEGKTKSPDSDEKNKGPESAQAVDGAIFCEKQKDMGVRRQPQSC